MKDIKIAFRNLSRQKKRSFLLGGAIAFGILIVTLINGFSGSFVENVGENFSHLLSGHIFIEGVEKTSSGKTIFIIRDDSILMETLKKENIPYKYLTKRSEFRGTLIFEGNNIQQHIVGVDWNAESYFKDRIVLKEGSLEGMSDPHAIILSSDIAKRLKAEMGDSIIVKLRTFTGQQNVGEFILAGISYDPGFFGSIAAYANFDYVNKLLNLNTDEYMTLGIYLDDMDQIDATADKYYTALSKKITLFDRNTRDKDENPLKAMVMQLKEEEWDGNRFRLQTLNDLLEEVEQIVDILNKAAFIILLILFIIIMVGITNTFRMIMFERIKEIGTMRAIGMQHREVKLLFLFEALLIALGGAAAGFITAGIIMFILSLIPWGMDTTFYILLKNGYMTFKVTPLQIGFNTLVVSVLTLVAAYFPARSASRLQPADALGTHK